MLIAADLMLLTDDDLLPGWVEIDGQRIRAVGIGTPPGTPDRHVPLLTPGLVDVHCHGGGGASFSEATPESIARAVAAHRTNGTTSVVASLVTGPIDDLVDQVSTLRSSVEDGTLAGIHLEGPWLAGAYKGAHNPDQLADPDPVDVARLLAAGRGTVAMVTIAPELHGARDAITRVVDHGAVAAVGHTAASFEATRDAIEAGARGATHLFNAMPALQHRDPGPLLALMADDRVTLELVVDGIHVDPHLAAFVLTTWPDRVALVTDAMAAAGAPDGAYCLGDLPVAVVDGHARIEGTDTIAGSTLTLDRAVRTAIRAGVPIADAFRSATRVPADYLGLRDVGRLQVGAWADLVAFELDDDDVPGAVIDVMVRGSLLPRESLLSAASTDRG